MSNSAHSFQPFSINKDLISQNIAPNNISVFPIEKIVFQFSLKHINFNSQFKLGFYYFFMELLSTQSPLFSFSKKDVSSWSVRKKDVVSIYVTLRGNSIQMFFKKISFLFFPRIKPFYSFSLKTGYKNGVVLLLKNISLFPEIERESSRFKSNPFFSPGSLFSLTFVFKDKSSLKAKKCFFRHLLFPIRL